MKQFIPHLQYICKKTDKYETLQVRIEIDVCFGSRHGIRGMYGKRMD